MDSDLASSYMKIETMQNPNTMMSWIPNRHRGHSRYPQPASDLIFRSTNSTRMAVREVAQRRYDATQRKKATSLGCVLVIMACIIYYVSDSQYDIGLTLQQKNSFQNSDFDGNSTSPLILNQSSSIAMLGKKDQSRGEKSGINGEPPPEEEIIEPGKEFLSPYRYFADVLNSPRSSDSNYFFHIPRSGGQTIKEIAGKCLNKVLASEVGVRDGHGQDETLQTIEYNGGNYVNVDTTSIDGLHRAAALGLVSSSLSDLITSSYFGEAGMLFDLHHKGRAFVLGESSKYVPLLKISRDTNDGSKYNFRRLCTREWN
jgi:hypothetical protein